MKLFKNYKKLYKIELSNRKLLEEKIKELNSRDEKWQKQEIAKVRVELKNARLEIDNLKLENGKLYKLNKSISKGETTTSKNNKKLKEEVAKLKIELEDTKGFLEQETQAKNELIKQRTNLRRNITNLTNALEKDDNAPKIIENIDVSSKQKKCVANINFGEEIIKAKKKQAKEMVEYAIKSKKTKEVKNNGK